ncbi:transposase [Eubacteriales bacterium OttesenSCG-928-N13]|nr:transposase [Eubacteriales bacterium OttesenSCG-928-N13]
MVDAVGNPIHVQRSQGNVNDFSVATDVLSHVPLMDGLVVADKEYGTKTIRDYINDTAFPLR